MVDLSLKISFHTEKESKVSKSLIIYNKGKLITTFIGSPQSAPKAERGLPDTCCQPCKVDGGNEGQRPSGSTLAFALEGGRGKSGRLRVAVTPSCPTDDAYMMSTLRMGRQGGSRLKRTYWARTYYFP